MAFFDSLTASLKQKWLPFYQENHAWIVRQMAVDSVETPDGGRRPSSYLILGVVSALVPELADLLLPLTKLNPDIDTLIDVLELNFDPELYLNNDYNPTNSFGEQMEELLDKADEVVILAPDEESIIVMDVSQTSELGDLSLDEMTDETVLEEFTQESLEPMTNQAEASGDFQSEGHNYESFQAQAQTQSGENKQSEDEEISRLFPNF